MQSTLKPRFHSLNLELTRKSSFSYKERQFDHQGAVSSLPTPPGQSTHAPLTEEEVSVTTNALAADCKKRHIAELDQRIDHKKKSIESEGSQTQPASRLENEGVQSQTVDRMESEVPQTVDHRSENPQAHTGEVDEEEIWQLMED